MTQALHTLLEHAEHERDEAIVALRQAEAQAQASEGQAEQLQLYRDEYECRHPARSGRAAPIELLRVHLNFMQRLEQAQSLQSQQLQQSRQRVEQRRKDLLALETRVAAVRKLLQRRQEDQTRISIRLEQRHNDETSQNLAWYHRQSSPLGMP